MLRARQKEPTQLLMQDETLHMLSVSIICGVLFDIFACLQAEGPLAYFHSHRAACWLQLRVFLTRARSISHNALIYSPWSLILGKGLQCKPMTLRRIREPIHGMGQTWRNLI